MLSRYRRGSKRTRVTKGIAAILLTSSGIPTLVHAGETASPIEHVVVIIGENWSFDSLFATNYHQPVMGGTGTQHIMLGSGDAFYYTDGHGHAMRPQANQIENPDPQPGTNNWYTQDGYGGGTYSNCSDAKQPGVGAILDYLAALPGKPKPNCAPGHYYLLNNYDPGYNGDGSLHTGNPFTIPPSPVRTIADSLLEKNISWKYYGEGWNTFITSPNTSVYCSICNPFLYETAIMTKPSVRTAHLKDTLDLYNDIAKGELPAVSFVKPGKLLDGHPASSKFDLFEAFAKKIVEEIKAKPGLWAHAAIFVTVDEGGGYYDSGYIQPLDFFGDGTRIPLIVVSPFSRGGGGCLQSQSDWANCPGFVR